MYSKVESEQKHDVAIIEREFKFRKRMAFSVLGSSDQKATHPSGIKMKRTFEIEQTVCKACYYNYV